MNLLSIENLSKAYADRPLFNSLNFGIAYGQKVALVGKNGAGKSTLLKILAGLVQPDDGQVTLRKGTTIGYLPQSPQLEEDDTILDNIFDPANEVAQTVLAYEKALEKGESPDDLFEKMEHLNAWDFEAKAKQVLGKLGIEDTDKVVKNLSGGQKKRVALAKLLLEAPDVILLDEPTNHLDIEAIEWLERFLVDQFQTIVIITHDRYFLESITDEILELADLKIYKHKGKYSDYLQHRMDRQQIAEVEKGKAQHLMKKELEWLRRQPQARGTKAKYRIDAFDGVKAKATKDISQSSLELNIRSTRQGKKVVELNDISHHYDDEFTVKGFTHNFARGERVGVVGKNGAGKSTFLNMITGQLSPKIGKVVIGETTNFGYYTQEAVSLNPANRVIEEVRDIAEYIMLEDGSRLSVTKFLEQFLFDSKQQYAYIDKLSGGEKRRLQLLKILVSEPNFLILDEPTNDFDIDTLNVLEEYLEGFDGGLLIVSHDRYFLDKLCDKLFVFEGEGKIRDYPGNYSDYRTERKKIQSEQSKSKEKAEKPKKTDGNKTKMSYNEKREYESLESEIDTLETKKAELNGLLNSGETSHEKLTEWALEIQKIDTEIDTKSERWMELDEKAN